MGTDLPSASCVLLMHLSVDSSCCKDEPGMMLRSSILGLFADRIPCSSVMAFSRSSHYVVGYGKVFPGFFLCICCFFFDCWCCFCISDGGVSTKASNAGDMCLLLLAQGTERELEFGREGMEDWRWHLEMLIFQKFDFSWVLVVI